MSADLTLQVSIPLLDVVAEDADLVIRYGTGRYADVEHVCPMTDEVAPLSSPAYLRDNGPFESIEELENGSLERILQRNVPSPHARYLCWRTGTTDRWECSAFAERLKKRCASASANTVCA